LRWKADEVGSTRVESTSPSTAFLLWVTIAAERYRMNRSASDIVHTGSGMPSSARNEARQARTAMHQSMSRRTP
jgi:hypothetical protein